MRATLKLTIVVCCLSLTAALAQTPNCPLRPAPGSVVHNPLTLLSKNGALSVDLTMQNAIDGNGFLHDCMNYQTGRGMVEAPTLHVRPGDQLTLNFTNAMTANPQQQAKSKMQHMAAMLRTDDPCQGTTMTALSTNIHFHGLNVPPVCHQDEVVHTLIQPGDATFQYKMTIPKNEPPGLYWYHPHPHGFTSLQVSAGAAGALIVAGMEKAKPEVAGLPSRVFVIRQQFLNAGVWLPGPNQLTINYQPALTPQAAAPLIRMKPGAREFWRVANATTVTFLSLQLVSGSDLQTMHVVALDGVPVQTDTDVTTLIIPPAGRAEFIVQGPPAGGAAVLQTTGFDTGPVGDPNPAQILASVLPDKNGDAPDVMPEATTGKTALPAQRFAILASQAATTKRKLYFSEATEGINGPVGFFITVEGQRPKLFAPEDPPAIVTHVGAVEDWTIENHTPEVHAFHMHQLHFLVMEINGKPVADPELRDTIVVPYWKGKGAFPKVKVRLDFRDPDIAGTFVYHCHILDHEDGGMMAKIEVDP